MARFRKTLAKVGAFRARNGPVHISRQRLEHWARQGNAMIRAGLRHPIPFGHQPHAVPANETEVQENEFWRGGLNAGYALGWEVTPQGEFVLTGEAPGLELDPESGCLVNRATGAVMKEMSLAFKDWVDGRGRVWIDAPVHAALTTNPVVDGQPGFEPAAAGAAGEATVLSLGNYLGDLFSVGDVMPEEAKTEEKKEPKGKEGGAKGYDLKAVLKHLGEHGITLPEDTDEENFMERIRVACTALHGEGGGSEPPAPAEEVKVDEEMPAMMSLEQLAAHPLVGQLLLRTQREEKAKREARINALKKRGLPDAKAKELLAEAGLTQLSLSDKGEPLESPLDAKLALLEASLPAEGKLGLGGWAPETLEEVAPPEGDPDNGGARAKSITDGVARRMGWNQSK